MRGELWNNDFVQFTRLLAEIRMAGMDSRTMKLLEASMDLPAKDIRDIFGRAEKNFESIKEEMAGEAKGPFELHDRLFKMFWTWFKTQDKITMVSHLLPEMLYTWISSPNKIDVGRVILKAGPDPLKQMMGIDDDCDAYINVEVSVFNSGTTTVKRWKHKKGAPLAQAWKEVESGE